MNGRYLIAFLLIGGMVYGLTTAVGNMLAEEDPMSAYSAQVEWSSVPGAGMSVRGGSPAVSVPMSSGNSSVLFHHPAVYGVAPQGYAAADRPSVYSGGSAVGSYAAHGLYLISSGSSQSYGGGAESGVYTSAGSGSAMPFATSSASGMSMAASANVSAYSLAPSYSASPSYAFAPQSATTAYASADQTLASRKGAQRRNMGTVDDNKSWATWFDWYVGNSGVTDGWTETDGTYYFTESQLRAAYEYWLKTQSSSMPIIKTFDDWLAWITGESNTTRYQLSPVGDGVIALLLLSAIYMAGIFIKQYRNRKIQSL